MECGAAPTRYTLYTTGDPAGYAHFYVGRVSDGRGVIAGECWAGLLAIWFDASGALLGHSLVPFRPDSRGHSKVTQIQAWLTAQGFRPEWIEVNDFDVEAPATLDGEEYHVYVHLSDYPFGLEPPSDPSDPDVQDRVEWCRQWEQDGCFVVHWSGGSIWMNNDGGYST